MAEPARTPHIDRILALEVPIVVRLGERKLRVAEVTALVPGAIIELPKNAETELDLLVHNRQVGLGRAVKVGENFGLKITQIGDQRERLAAATDEPSSDPIADEAATLAERLLSGQ